MPHFRHTEFQHTFMHIRRICVHGTYVIDRRAAKMNEMYVTVYEDR